MESIRRATEKSNKWASNPLVWSLGIGREWKVSSRFLSPILDFVTQYGIGVQSGAQPLVLEVPVTLTGVDNEFSRRYSLSFGMRRFLVLTCGGAVLIEPDAE